jgi:hypothetical protein
MGAPGREPVVASVCFLYRRLPGAMLSSELGNRYAATRVGLVGRRHRGDLAACGAQQQPAKRCKVGLIHPGESISDGSSAGLAAFAPS